MARACNGWGRSDSACLLSIASNRRRPHALDSFLFDVREGTMRLVATNPGIGRITDISRDGWRAVLARVEHRSDDNLLLVDLRSSSEILLTPHDGPGNFQKCCRETSSRS